MIERCKKCEKKLSADEIGLHKKLCGKFAVEFCCIECNAKEFNVSVRLLKQKIKEWREMGCSLFK